MTTTHHLAGIERAVAEVERLRDLHPVGNPLPETVGQGTDPTVHLRRLVAIEMQCHAAELVAYGTLTARFHSGAAPGFWLALGRLVQDATPKLREAARALGMTEADWTRWPAERGAYAYNGALSWVAMTGGQAAAALAVHTDMAVYFPGGMAVVRRLREAGADVPQEFTSYYDDPGDDALRELALEVGQEGLDRGDDPEEAVFHARRTEEAIGDIWSTAALSS
ncbi:hypothetical protein V1J52_01540 [Streptomyces sp. TRM 70351]|uniref:hypothetical protein n=1 Tax=Streptomyces sp. TRM 70351 TaxID=3116552 RepID=UPI002E7B175B|nr:hypothetical protein [Streptomyces sp. TRM 70351]MEE1926877.1 hypothetical protein [Streptomyces sp. TRM 70351]